MAGNRKAAEAVVFEGIEALMPGSDNKRIYEELFASMDDEQFEEWIAAFEGSPNLLPIIAPNMPAKGTSRLSVKRNLELAEKWGVKLFERIWQTNDDGTRYLSTLEYMVVPLPLRRQAQILEKKISIPEDNNTVDDLTGQAAGSSKGSKVSFPQIQILASHGLDKTLLEMLKMRGGDTKAFNAMNAEISKTGSVSIDNIAKLGTEVKSTTTLNTFLTCMHLGNTLSRL